MRNQIGGFWNSAKAVFVQVLSEYDLSQGKGKEQHHVQTISWVRSQQNFFCKGLSSKYFKLCGLYRFYLNSSDQLCDEKAINHGLCSNKTLWTMKLKFCKISTYHKVVFFRLLFQLLKTTKTILASQPYKKHPKLGHKTSKSRNSVWDF